MKNQNNQALEKGQQKIWDFLGGKRKREEPRDEEMKNGGEEEEVERKKTKREKTQSITTTLEASSLKNTAGVPFGISCED